MPYMKMVPLIAELKTHLGAPSAATNKRIDELMALLPAKDTLTFSTTLEMASEDYAHQRPILQRIKALEDEETAELAKMEELKKLAAVKWGPKKLPTGETQTSVQKRLDTLTAELDGLTEKAKALDERMAPLLEMLKELDATYKNQADVDAWAARGYTGEVPVCVLERQQWEEAEFLEGAEVLPLRRSGRKL
jgi:hypothetical protein